MTIRYERSKRIWIITQFHCIKIDNFDKFFTLIGIFN